MARLRFLAHAAAAATMAAGLLTVVFTGTASACSCLPGDTEPQRYARANYVFAGVVVGEKLETNKPETPYDDQYRYTVKVSKEYKGDVPHRVDVLTSTSGSLCGIRLTVNTKYLVFANGDLAVGTLGTHLCSGTRLASGGPPNTVPSPTPTTTTPPTTPCATAAP